MNPKGRQVTVQIEREVLRRILGQRKERDCQIMGNRCLALFPFFQGRTLNLV